MATLHWALRAHLKDLREDGRLAVLTALILHANMRNRCWVSTDLLIEETGWSRPSIVHAKQWLAARGAFVLVPFRKRVEEETKLPRRQHVYQLTGVMKFDGAAVPYLFMTPESQAAIEAVVSRLESKATESKATESSVGKSSVALPKGSSLLEGGSSLKGGSLKEDDSAAARSNVFALYEQNIGMLTPMLGDKLKDAAKTYPEAWIQEAFEQAVIHNKRSWAYAETILKRWEREGRGADQPKPPAASTNKPAASNDGVELDEV